MVFYSKHWSWTLFAVLISLIGYSQKPSIQVGVGLASVAGELSSDNPLQDPIGMDYSLSYILPFGNERWAFMAESNFSHQNMSHDFSKNAKILYKNGQAIPTPLFQSASRQTYLGVGLRFYLTGTINRYNPYKGQILPYISISVGALNSSITLQGEESVPADYGLHEGSTFEATGQFGGGIGYVFNRDIIIEVFGALRPGFSDYWDGIQGITNTKDWLARGGLGIQYKF